MANKEAVETCSILTDPCCLFLACYLARLRLL